MGQYDVSETHIPPDASLSCPPSGRAVVVIQIVEAKNIIASGKQLEARVEADEASSACNQNLHGEEETEGMDGRLGAEERKSEKG